MGESFGVGATFREEKYKRLNSIHEEFDKIEIFFFNFWDWITPLMWEMACLVKLTFTHLLRVVDWALLILGVNDSWHSPQMMQVKGYYYSAKKKRAPTATGTTSTSSGVVFIFLIKLFERKWLRR